MIVQIGGVEVRSNDSVGPATYEVLVITPETGKPPLRLGLRPAIALRDALTFILDPAHSGGLPS